VGGGEVCGCFFFQAEDGIRDWSVTGVQTCALPIWHQSIRANVRVIAATNQDLESRVREGLFREDLYHRLNVIRMRLPSLSERREIGRASCRERGEDWGGGG